MKKEVNDPLKLNREKFKQMQARHWKRLGKKYARCLLHDTYFTLDEESCWHCHKECQEEEKKEQTKYNLKRINGIKDKGVKISILRMLLGRKSQQIKHLSKMVRELKEEAKKRNEEEDMVANSWTWAQCPKCKNEAEKRVAVLRKKAQEAYGQVPEKAYNRLLRESKEPIGFPAGSLHKTLREEYEIGICDGEFQVSYSAHCTKCGFTHKFEAVEPVLDRTHCSG